MFLLSLLLICIPLAISDTIITQSGSIEGSTVYFMQKPVDRYLGIPFAQPPVGDLRFKKPVPVEPWNYTLQAVDYPPSCIQFYPFDYPWVDAKPYQSENCLYLNIWVPQAQDYNQKPKAVMFYTFSGAFTYGSNRLPVYDGQVLAAEGEVIVVLVNYRIGMLGFLSTGTTDAPGNMGALDVLEALKWTKRNIGAFGGDPDKITIFGHSAGSIISGYLMISPLSTGLFKRVIMESGSPILILSEDPMASNYELGQLVAVAVDCASNTTTLKNSPHEVVGCLRKRNADVLIKITNSFNPCSILSFIPIHGDELLPIDPIVAFKSGDFQDVDVMIGNVKDEGSFFIVSEFCEIFGPYGERNPKINKSLGEDLILEVFKDYHLNTFQSLFKQDVANYYLANVGEYDYDTVRSQAYHSMGDFLLNCPSIYFAEGFEKKKSKVFLYYFYHQSKTVFAPWMGVTHFTEIPFVFGRPLDDPLMLYSQEEMQLSRNMIRMWTEFAKKGFPSPMWQQFSRSHSYIHEIYTNERGDNYLNHHLANCDFFRKYFGYV